MPNRTRWQRHWNVMASKDTNGRPSETFDLAIAQDVGQKLGLRTQDVILDAGCGTGIIEKYFPNNFIIAMDFSRLMVCRPHITHGVVADSTYFPLKPTSVDKICIYSLIQYLQNKEVASLLSEVSRCMVDGGRCLIGDVELRSKRPANIARFLVAGALYRRRFHYRSFGWLSEECDKRYLKCEVLHQRSSLPYHQIRVDLLITKK